jgi:hypothetical protein
VVRLGITFLLLFAAASARAQSLYVAGTIGADISRVGHTDSNLYPSSSSGSEAISGSLRVGAAVGPAWGVELEFVHSARTRTETIPRVLPVLANYEFAVTALPATGVAPNISIPILNYQTDVRRSHSDLDAIAWVRQSAGDSVDMVYTGGLVFSRERVEITQNFPTAIRLFAPVPNGSFRTVVIGYGTHPLAGVEARVRFTSHVRLIPGVRLQGMTDGWLMRPYVGLGWFF